MGVTSAKVKYRYSKKHYQQWRVDIPFDLYDKLEFMRGTDPKTRMSRTELLRWFVDVKARQRAKRDGEASKRI